MLHPRFGGNRARLPALACCLCFAGTALSADKPNTFSKEDLRKAVELRDSVLDSGLAYELVRSLTAEVGSRFAGSPGDRAAIAWAAERMRQLGLDHVRTTPVVVPRWERGLAELRIVAPIVEPLAGIALGGSVGTPDKGIEADIVYAPDVDALKTLSPLAVAGRIIFLDTRMQRTRDSSGYLAAVRSRMAGASSAAQLGAVAVVVRSIGTSSGHIAHTGIVQYRTDVPRIPAFAISNDDADALGAQLRAGQAVRLFLRSSSKDAGSALSANVLGEIRGTQRADEVVLMAAHLDSWDVGQGAVDDGAGIAIVLAAAASIRQNGLRPRRTIRVVLFANEEFGLTGAREYAAALPEPGFRHVVAIEADSGADRVWRLDSRVAPAASEAVRTIAALLRPLGVELGAAAVEGSSDLAPLHAAGIPIVGLAQDRSRYFDVHHTADDTLDRIDRGQIAQATAAWTATVWLLAQYPGAWGPSQLIYIGAQVAARPRDGSACVLAAQSTPLGNAVYPANPLDPSTVSSVFGRM